MATKTESQGSLGEKVFEEKNALLSATPQIDTQRLNYLLEVSEEAMGEPPVIRTSKLFGRLCSFKDIFIDNNPIVGTLTKYKYGSYPVPEIGCRWMKKTDRFALQRGYAELSEEDIKWVHRAVDYWKDKNVFNRTRAIIDQSHGVDIALWSKCGVGTEFTPGGFIDGIPDYDMVLKKGLKGLIEEVEVLQENLDTGDLEGLNKWYFYQGTRLCLDGMINLAKRYARLAEQMAREEKDPERKEELERIAQTCEWVPERPARNFLEAIQTTWFIMLGVWMGSPTVLFSPPSRFTQYMYPFYKKDKDDGLLDDEMAGRIRSYLGEYGVGG